VRSPTEAACSPPSRGRGARWPVAGAAGAGLALLAAARILDVGQYSGAVHEWVEALGPLGPAAYVVLYVAATLVGVPSMPFSLLAPVLFGVGTAIAIMLLGSTTSAAFGFLIARYVARDAIEEWLAHRPGVARLATLVERHDWLLIAVLRTVPIAPFVAVNYSFGLTRIRFWRYLVWSALAMVPPNVALVMGGHVFYDAIVKGMVSWPVVAGATGAAGVVLALLVVGRRTLSGSALARWTVGEDGAPAVQGQYHPERRAREQ
jgi:uncharacterized membrane protein YdjX (TVP38/TMEM64 family)